MGGPQCWKSLGSPSWPSSLITVTAFVIALVVKVAAMALSPPWPPSLINVSAVVVKVVVVALSAAVVNATVAVVACPPSRFARHKAVGPSALLPLPSPLQP